MEWVNMMNMILSASVEMNIWKFFRPCYLNITSTAYPYIRL